MPVLNPTDGEMISHLLSRELFLSFLVLQVVDSLQGVGAIRCATLGDAQLSAQGENDSSGSRHQQLVVGSGMGRSGVLAILQQSLVPETITEVPLPGNAALLPKLYHSPEFSHSAVNACCTHMEQEAHMSNPNDLLYERVLCLVM